VPVAAPSASSQLPEGEDAAPPIASARKHKNSSPSIFGLSIVRRFLFLRGEEENVTDGIGF
jgi:hypothetical protein